MHSFTYALSTLRSSNGRCVLVASKLDLLISDCEPDKRRVVVAAFKALATEYNTPLLGLNLKDKTLHTSLMLPFVKHVILGEQASGALRENLEPVAANRPLVFFPSAARGGADLSVQLRSLEQQFGKWIKVDPEIPPSDELIDSAIEKRRAHLRLKDDLIDF